MWLALAAASGIGLWFSESRSALGAAGAVLIGRGVLDGDRRLAPRGRAAALAAVVVALLAGAAMSRPAARSRSGLSRRRLQRAVHATSVRMIAAHPLFGVGVGQYYRTSPLFLSPQLAWSTASRTRTTTSCRSAAELGVVGLGLFVVWLGAALARSARALARQPADARLLGIGGGVSSCS